MFYKCVNVFRFIHIAEECFRSISGLFLDLSLRLEELILKRFSGADQTFAPSRAISVAIPFPSPAADAMQRTTLSFKPKSMIDTSNLNVLKLVTVYLFTAIRDQIIVLII